MKIPFVHKAPLIFIGIGLIVVSTAALSYFSYYYTVGRENLVETSLVQSNIKLASQALDRIEKKIEDNDRLLLDMVDVNEPSKWPDMVEAIKRADLNVDQVYFLRPDSDWPLYPPYSHEIRNQWGAFRASFKLKDLELDRLAPNQPHHLHMERPKNYFFATYVLKEARDGARILVCYQMNFDKILALIDSRLRDLQDRFYVSIVDFEGNGVYGQPLPHSKYFFETRFPNTLYKWLLQIVPRNYTELELNVSNRRRTNLLFIIASMLLIFISLAIILNTWKRDRQLRKLKEDFISNVSHELKTPLSLIRMFSEMLVMGRAKDEDKKQEYYRVIHSESDRMSRLIANLLDFANLGRGVEFRHFENTSIAQLVTKALEAYRHDIQKEGIQLSLDIDPDVPNSYADPNSITMAFINLLDNSIKYSGEKKKIDIRIQKNNGYVDLSVTDNGVGIPESEQQKIFDKFFRGSDPSVRRVRGSGIGLAITKHVAELHQGEILVKSEPGQGSTFTLRIPIRTVEDNSGKISNLKSRISN
ncbi:MAG: HAMP domain-containing sensor histidine kinase [Acidobacteriota bacterium]|nr:HAMP domain-containing sensor histidine kinase [Acidobacteriota bacterium]